MHLGCAINLAGNLFDFCFHRILVGIGELQRLGVAVFNGVHHKFCQFQAAFAAFGKHVVDGKAYTNRAAVLSHEGNLGIGVGGVAIECNHHFLSELAHVGNVLIHILETAANAVEVLLLDVVFGHAAVHLQALCSGNNHCQAGC